MNGMKCLKDETCGEGRDKNVENGQSKRRNDGVDEERITDQNMTGKATERTKELKIAT